MGLSLDTVTSSPVRVTDAGACLAVATRAATGVALTGDSMAGACFTFTAYSSRFMRSENDGVVIVVRRVNGGCDILEGGNVGQ